MTENNSEPAVELTPELVASSRDTLISAFKSLLPVEVDGAASAPLSPGYNTFDLAFAVRLNKVLISIGEHAWSGRQRYAVWRMLAKYRKELLERSVVYENIPRPELAAEDLSKRIVSYIEESKLFEIRFEFNPELIEELKTVFHGRHWKSEVRAWCLDASRFNVVVLQDFAGKYGFILDEYADKAVHDILDSEQPVGEVIYDRVKNVFLIKFPYSEDLKERVKQMRGAKWDQTERIWKYPPDYTLLDDLERFCREENFAIAGGAKEAILNIRASIRGKIDESYALDANITVPGFKVELYPFQRAGVRFAQAREGNILIADAPGLGKTFTSLASVHLMGLYPCLVICPASVKYNWQREIRRALPDKTVEVVEPKMGWFATDITIINYDLLLKYLPQMRERGYRSLILDESHYIKEGKAQRSKAALELASIIPKKFLLTGTPMVNRPRELVTQLTALGRIDDFEGAWKFLERYCAARTGRFGWDISGASNLEELSEKLRVSCMVRRLKQDVLTELPEKQYSLVPFELNNVDEYNRAEADVAVFLGERAAKNKVFLDSIKHHPPEKQKELIAERARSVEETAARNEELLKIELLKQLCVKGKLHGALDWMKNIMDSGEKLVVFALHTAIVDIIYDKFRRSYGAVRIYGNTPLKERDAAVQSFQTDDSVRLFVGNMRAAGVGITLTASSQVAFIELDWTPSSHQQAADRLHRISQKNSVNVYYLLAAKTIDEEIYELLEDKRAIIDAGIDGITTPAPESAIYQQLVNIISKRHEKKDK